MAKIVLDIDDTMVPSLGVQIDCISQEHGTNYTTHDFRAADRNWLKFSKMTPAELQETFIRRKLLERVQFHAKNRNIWEHHIKKWTAEGHEVMICTARDWHPDAMNITKEMLGAEIWTRAPIFLVSHDHSKSKIDRLRDVGIFPDMFVDDNPREIEAAVRAGVPIVFRNFPVIGDSTPLPMGESACFEDQEYIPLALLTAAESHLQTLVRGTQRLTRRLAALEDRVDQTRAFMHKISRRRDSKANAVLADEWRIVDKFTQPVLVRHDTN